MESEDSLYEIASTDAWRHLMEKLEGIKKDFEGEVMFAAKRIDFKSTEVARFAGRVEAIEHVQSTLRQIGAKPNAQK